jgi:hypothetical protein
MLWVAAANMVARGSYTDIAQDHRIGQLGQVLPSILFATVSQAVTITPNAGQQEAKRGDSR